MYSIGSSIADKVCLNTIGAVKPLIVPVSGKVADCNVEDFPFVHEVVL